jgi:DNA-binding transcriptional ArsR family regulator
LARTVSDVFKALADPTRRAILDELIDRDGQTLTTAVLDDTCGNLIQIATAT